MNKEYAEYLLEKTRQDYNLIAQDFANKRERIWEETRFLLENYLKPNEKVLDLGCGNGRYFPLFKEKSVDYYGIDSSKDLIKIAQRDYPAGKFQVGEALKLPFDNNFFDKVYSIAVLHNIPSEEFRLQFLKEAGRILKSKGLLILTVWKIHQFKESHLLFKYIILKLIGKSKMDWKDFLEPWDKKVERYYHSFSLEELSNLVKKAGFKIQEKGIIKNRRGNRQNLYIICQK